MFFVALLLYFLLVSLYVSLISTNELWGCKKKEKERDKEDIGNLFEKSSNKGATINSLFKTIYIIGQGNALCRQRIPSSSSARKGTIDINIFITSRNGDKKNHATYQDEERTCLILHPCCRLVEMKKILWGLPNLKYCRRVAWGSAIWGVKQMSSPFPCSPVIRECSWKKTRVEKNVCIAGHHG